jgi:hypothetical protein
MDLTARHFGAAVFELRSSEVETLEIFFEKLRKNVSRVKMTPWFDFKAPAEQCFRGLSQLINLAVESQHFII